MDKIIVKGLCVFAYRGINTEERHGGQHFIIDLTVSVDLSATHAGDSIDDTVSYTKIMRTAIHVMAEQSYDLPEWVAQRAAEQIFQEYPAVVEPEVLLIKPEAPIQAEFEYTAVSIARKRNDFD